METDRSKKRFDLQRSGVREVITTFLILCLFVGVLIFYYGMLFKQTRDGIIKSQELSAVTEAEQIDKYLSTGIYTMRFSCFTLDNMIRNDRPMSEIEDFIMSQSEAIVNIMSGNSDGLYGYIGGEFLDGNGWEPDESYDPTDRPWFINARANIGRVAIVDPYYDLESQTMTISLAKTLCDAESVAAMDFSLEYMQKLTENLSSQSDSDMDFVLDQDFTVITHSDKSEVGKSYLTENNTFGRALAEELRTTEESYFSFKFGGAEYIVYRVPVANDWICVSVYDATAVFRQMQRTLIFTIFIICFVAAVIIVIMYYVSRKMQRARQLESDIKEKDDELKKMSIDTYRDSLTGVKNKAAFDKYCQEMAEKMKSRVCAPFSVLMMDVNNLKQINDTYGHEAGDEYIKGTCMMMCKTFKYSPIFRLGGDEFVAVLQNSDYEDRTALMHKLEDAYIDTFEKTDADPWRRYTASLGISDYMEGDSSVDEILKRSDRFMYEKKEAFHTAHGRYR
ncbi:MAG: diguanylate cyclase [Butyrivibrio sp.]|nr:diguanylate cyclase [Butyrivibrio sp.]